MTKSFLSSKTIWVNMLSFIAAMLGAANIDIGLTPEVQGTIAIGGLAVVNVILRAMTSSKIALFDPDVDV